MAKRKSKQANEPDVVAEIRSMFPDGIIDWMPDAENWNFSELREPLTKTLSRINGASIRYECPPDGEMHEDEDELPEWTQPPRSYHTLFVCPTDKRFEVPADGEYTDAEGVTHETSGTGHVGCTVGISMVAAYATIKPDFFSLVDDGTETIVEDDPAWFAVNGPALRFDAHLEEMLGSVGVRELRALRGKIAGVLDGFGVTVLTDEREEMVVPGLKMNNGFCAACPVDKVTVLGALFFMEP